MDTGELAGALGSGAGRGRRLRADLPRVLHTAPAAVLVIDVARRQVVYANAAAIELTGDRLRLPVDIDAWGDAAGLTDLGGRRMSETGSPLSLVAAGMPVNGEPVAVRDAARRGSTATTAQRDAAEGRLLWATGFPLAGADAGAGRTARMVVFQQLSGDRGRATAASWRCCATGPWWPPTCRSPSPTPGARTTRWSG